MKDGIPLLTYHGWGWLPYVQYGKLWLWLRVGMALFKRYMSRHGKPDLIHAHNAQWAGVLASRIKKNWGIPYVLSEHSSAYARKLVHRSVLSPIQEAFRMAEHRLVVSPSLGHVLERTVGESVCPWEWVPNVLSDVFEQNGEVSPVRKARGAPFLFLNVGALIEVKGHEQLLVAFASQFREKREVHLRIGGEGPLRSRLKGLAERLGIQDQVAFLGELSREGVLAEMQRSDVYVHSSRYETFGVTLIEALSCGKAVVSTACGGPECIVQESNGVLVPPGDPAALGEAMVKIMGCIGDYEAVSIREDCLNRFGQKALVVRLSDCYQSVIHSI